MADTLAAQGYEPRQDADSVVLADCRSTHWPGPTRRWYAGMNLALITALLEDSDLTARLDYQADDRCCVTIKR